MKSFFSLLSGILLSLSFFAQSVELTLEKTELKKDEPLRFEIKASPEILLEMAVFSQNETLVLHQTSRLGSSVTPIEVDMKGYPAGKYFVLILGDDLNLQQEFFVVE